MTCDNGLCINDQEWIKMKMKMKTPIHFNNNENEIIAWCLLNVRLCLLLNNHHHCMCCYRWCSLHHIYASRVTNDNVHQSPKVVSSDKDIHSLLGVAKERVGDLHLNMCSTLQSNSCDNIPKCVMGYCMLIFARSVPVDLLQRLARSREAKNWT
jgi:hypothetical protein